MLWNIRVMRCKNSNRLLPKSVQYYINYNIQVNSGFSPALASGFTAICIANTCGGGTCEDPNRFFGTFVVSNLNCTATPLSTCHPIIVPIQALLQLLIQRSPVHRRYQAKLSLHHHLPSLQWTQALSPRVFQRVFPTAPSISTYNPTIVELVGERK